MKLFMKIYLLNKQEISNEMFFKQKAVLFLKKVKIFLFIMIFSTNEEWENEIFEV